MKQEKRFKIKEWLNDHTVEILIGGLAIACTTAGYLIGHQIGECDGAIDVHNRFADMIPKIVDDCGCTGSNTILNWLKENYKDLYDQVRDVIDWKEIAAEYYENPNIQVFTAGLIKKH